MKSVGGQSFFLFIVVAVGFCLGGVAQTPQVNAGVGDTPTTVSLQLETVHFEVMSLPHLQDRLKAQALDLFAKQNLPLPSTTRLPHQSGTLQLRLMAEPIGEVCSDGWLYESDLTLISPIMVPRSSHQILAMTWNTKAPAHTIETANIAEVMQRDGQEMIEKFIGYIQYSQGVYPEYSSQETNLSVQQKRQDSTPPRPSSQSLSTPIANLAGLPLNQVKFSIGISGKPPPAFNLNGVSYAMLVDRFRHQYATLAQKQFPVKKMAEDDKSSGARNKELRLKLHVWPAQPACPHARIYQAELQLSESVQIKRNGLSFMSDTWTRRKIAVVQEVAIEQLQADGEALIAQFFAEYKTSNLQR